MDEAWITKTKEQWKEWKHRGFPHPKKFKTQKSTGKLLPSIFWDKDGMILADYLEDG